MPHEESQLTFIVRYYHNMEVLYFGAYKPDDTYYLSPLKINVLGILDCSIKGESFKAHTYNKGQGKIVATMLLLY